MSLLRRRMMMAQQQVDGNSVYVNEAGTTYHKYEVYEGENQTQTMYQNCEYMETFEAKNCKYIFPNVNITEGFVGCTNLRSIKMPKAQSLGHYVFEGLSNLEYLQLGSIENPFTSAGYFRESPRTIGSDVGLTVEIYMEEYPTGNVFMGEVADNTTLIIRSSVTGEILTE